MKILFGYIVKAFTSKGVVFLRCVDTGEFLDSVPSQHQIDLIINLIEALEEKEANAHMKSYL